MELSPEELVLLQEKVKILFTLVCLLWAIHAINSAVFQGGLTRAFGLRPRTPWGLFGIATYHFLHGEGSHLPGNTSALVPLGALVLLQGIGIFYAVSLVIGLIAGLGTWLFGAEGVHVGFSGIIFGYIGFLLLYGLVGGNILAFLVAAGVGLKYGQHVTGSEQLPSGILPSNRGGGWIGHLFGFIGGIVAAYLLGYVRLAAS